MEEKKNSLSKHRRTQSEIEVITFTKPNTRLGKAGFIVPGELTDPDEQRFTLDLTAISSIEVGKSHSYWAARHSHAIYQLALRKEKLVILKSELRQLESQWRYRAGDSMPKWATQDAMMQNTEISERHKEIATLEAEVVVIEALVSSYDDFRQAASRELTRRFNERSES